MTAAIVATPAPSHVPLGRALLEQGLHVLLEKPLALGLDGLEDLRRARDQAGRQLAVAYVHRRNPALRAARAFIRTGSWGPVLHATVASGQDFAALRPAYRQIYYRDRAQGGGCLQDALTHSIDGLSWILGPAREVLCDAAHQALDGVTVEDTVNLLSRHGPALVGFLANQFQAPNEARWDLHLPGGSVRIEMRRFRWGRFARGAADWTWEDLPAPGADGIFSLQAGDFLDACEGRPTELCTLEEGRETVRFTLAAFRSLESRAWAATTESGA